MESSSRRPAASCLGEADVEALRQGVIGLLVAFELRDGRRLRNDVVAKVVPAHAALRALVVGAVVHGGRLKGALQVRLGGLGGRATDKRS